MSNNFQSAFHSFSRNSSHVIEGVYDIAPLDVSFILLCGFMIFTMQTGFGLLESGIVARKSQVNIMMKNIADIIFGGFTYWLFGFAFSYGRGYYTNPFIALGDFAVDPPLSDPLMGHIMTSFFFQMSFATTATTIVSGAVAERCNFQAYSIFSFFNTIVYCIPAGWVWGEHGFLRNIGVVDIAGSGPVHLIGGASALAASIMLGPRTGRYDKGRGSLPMGNPVNACVGLFFLWFGWLAFNSGSTYGMSDSKWEYSARSAVMTMLASFGGGMYGFIYSFVKRKGKADPSDVINGILGALVGITAGCYLYRAWESILVGIVGSAITLASIPFFDKLSIDDPVGASSVHGVSGIWGVIAVGLFSEDPYQLGTTSGRTGLFKGGGFYLLGVQTLSALCLAFWGIFVTFLMLWLVNKIIPLRMERKEEMLGPDISEHNIYDFHEPQPKTTEKDGNAVRYRVNFGLAERPNNASHTMNEVRPEANCKENYAYEHDERQPRVSETVASRL